MQITDECINCGACSDECEHNAIYNAGDKYMLNDTEMNPISEEHSFIVPEFCNNCKSCVEVCAVDAIVD